MAVWALLRNPLYAADTSGGMLVERKIDACTKNEEKNLRSLGCPGGLRSLQEGEGFITDNMIKLPKGLITHVKIIILIHA